MYSAHTHFSALKGLLMAVVVSTLVMTNAASGAVSGFNADLVASEGMAFIPLTPATSGTLGDPLGNKSVGSIKDTVRLGRNGATTGGVLLYDLYFDLGENLSPTGEKITYSASDVRTESMELYLDLNDIDFLPVFSGGAMYYEKMTLTFMRLDEEAYYDTGFYGDEGDMYQPGPSLTIDVTNYGEFRPDGFGTTNNEAHTYTINMENDLGLSQDDFDQLLGMNEFTLLVTVESSLTRIRGGAMTYTNQPEYLGDYSAGSADNGFSSGDPEDLPVNALTFELIPEPMTLSLLAIGSLALLRRRRH